MTHPASFRFMPSPNPPSQAQPSPYRAPSLALAPVSCDMLVGLALAPARSASHGRTLEPHISSSDLFSNRRNGIQDFCFSLTLLKHQLVEKLKKKHKAVSNRMNMHI